ncbi:MAG TPA: hypothetical protein VFS20_08520 [Longimicrobium sp.]|nr:hypothetical protein [Longimicrobium sp.]
MASKPVSRPTTVREQMLQECEVLARYALASGMSVPAPAINAIETARFAPADQPFDTAALVKAHDQLCRLVAPATPRALMIMGDEHNAASRLAWMGSVGFVRRMMAAAVISVILFFALSATHWTTSGASKTFLDGEGLVVVMNQLFWMSAAGIGASFALLRQVNDYIVARNYDPKYEPTYWIKFLLGVMAGFIMAALLPEVIGAQTEGASNATTALGVPTMAMLGGFSASAVYRILSKIVESIENVFRSSPREEATQREKAAQVKASEDISQMRMNVASQIVALQQELTSGKDPAQLSETLRGVLGSLMPASAPEPAPSPAPAAAPAPTVALPNTPIVSDGGTVQAPVAPAPTDEPAPAPSADAGESNAPPPWASDESGEAEPVAAPSAEATATNGDDETQNGAVG